MDNGRAPPARRTSYQPGPFSFQTYQPLQLQPQFDPYWNFQSVIFRVELTLFSVWKQEFLVKGTPFETMFSLPTGDTKKVEGTGTDKPIVLEGISAEDFRAFLRVLYPLGVLPVKLYSEWLGVLRLAHKWEFVEIRNKAVKALTPLISSQPANEKIKMGNKFLVREWLKQGLVDLALKKDLEIQMLRQEPYNFNDESIINLFYIQSKAWQKLEDSRQEIRRPDHHSFGYQSPVSTNFHLNLESYVAGRVEEIFATELAKAVYSPTENS